MLVEAGSLEHFPLTQAQHYPENHHQHQHQHQHHLPSSSTIPASEMERPPMDRQNSDIMTYSQYVNGSIFSIPKCWSQKSTDDLLMTVYSFVKTFCASGAGQGSIDNRIEQAMDLVKSHLMSAVRSEVEELRDKISKLEDEVNILSRDNALLRSHVNPEVLSQLTLQGRTLLPPQILNSLAPPEPSHPSLQPPQH